MSDYTEIVARVRGITDPQDFRPRLHNGSTFVNVSEVADLRSLCAAVERLERERDQAIADEKLAVANADRMTDEVIRLTAERDAIFCDPYSFYLGRYSCLCTIQEARKKDLPTWCPGCGEGTLSFVHRCDIDSRDELIREVRVRKPYTGGPDAE